MVCAYTHCGQTQESGSVTNFMHLKWNHFWHCHTQSSECHNFQGVHICNECMLLPAGYIMRGYHTNNYSETGIHILKDIVFRTIKAYNLIQVFEFLTMLMLNRLRKHCEKPTTP